MLKFWLTKVNDDARALQQRRLSTCWLVSPLAVALYRVKQPRDECENDRSCRLCCVDVRKSCRSENKKETLVFSKHTLARGVCVAVRQLYRVTTIVCAVVNTTAQLLMMIYFYSSLFDV